MHSQLNILPPNAMQPNITDAIDLSFNEVQNVSVDTLSKTVILRPVDTVLSVDNTSRQITDKRVSDTLRLSDWLEVKQSPQSDPWS